MFKKTFKFLLIISGLISGIFLIYLGSSDSPFFLSEKKSNNDINAELPINNSSDLTEIQNTIIDNSEIESEIETDTANIDEIYKNIEIVDEKNVQNILPELTFVEPQISVQSFNIEIDTNNMILIPAGQFLFSGNSHQKTIFVDDFYIDKFEVSNAEFKKNFPAFKFKAGDEQKPVTGVTYSEALEFAKKNNKDLPTVFEWEKAASWNSKNKRKLKYPWGNDFNETNTNSGENYAFLFEPVNSMKHKDISPYGVFFMAGNASEWTKTIIEELIKIIPSEQIDNFDSFKIEDSNKIKFGFICKGGSIFDNKEKLTTYYYYASDGSAQTGIGFRCVYRPANK